MMTILTIVRGLPGSGKSTFARSLECFHVEEDMFRIRNGKYRFNWTDGVEPQLKCGVMADVALHMDCDVAVSNYFVTIDEMKPFFAMAKRRNATLRVVKCVGRWIPRHDIEKRIIDMMKQHWEDYEGEEIYDSD